ncbi:MAG: FMN-binding glutamate synthase family protein [Betaproteobacteria bacterium]|nr:FMN-binding glutamate synthase family protein [Betaproteobacteria bacterium]
MSKWFAKRFLALHLCWIGALVLLFWPQGEISLFGVPVLLALCGVGLIDLWQTQHAVRRNYPILGHIRFLLEYIRPEIRQYFLEDDTTATPFSRTMRSIAYQRAKQQTDKRPFGTRLDVYATGHEWLNHAMVPAPLNGMDFRVLVGADRAQPYSMSLFNISAMSFGALSGNAILALNQGAKMGGFAHDTGEGSISKYHREHGGDLVWNVGSGYFGCRTPEGRFDPKRFATAARDSQVKLIEIKLSQGAKPGHGGVLPASKVTAEIAEARGIPTGVDCISPAAHHAFGTPIELLEWMESMSVLSGGKPVGIKLCVGHPWEFFALAKAMLYTGLLPDFIVVDGAEGGTGAAPLEFTDHVGMPLQDGLRLVHNTLTGIGLRDQIRIGASGKIITAFDIVRTLAMGADWCNAARGFMFALGCIQAQICHTGACPTGITTQDALRQRALVVPDRAVRVRNYHHHTLEALAELVAAAGVSHPSGIEKRFLMRRLETGEVCSFAELMPDLSRNVLVEALDIGHLPEPFRTCWESATPKSWQIGDSPQ